MGKPSIRNWHLIPLNFSHQRKQTKQENLPIKRCNRCGRFSNEDLCDTHKRVKSEQQKQSTNTETFPTMPAKQTEEIPDITTISDSQSSQDEESPSTANIDPEITVTADVKYGDGNTDEKADKPKTAKHQQFRHRSAAAWAGTSTYDQRCGPNPNRITAKGLKFSI